MSDSRKSKSRSRRHSSRASYQDQSADHGSSDSDDLSDAQNSPYKQERRRMNLKFENDFSRSQTKSDSLDKGMRNSSPQIKSLVTVPLPLPSLLTSSCIVPSRNKSAMKAKVVQNKPGSEKKGLVAKSLMDLQFEDRMLNVGGCRSDRIDRRPGLLPEPFEMFSQDHMVDMRQKISDGNYGIMESNSWTPGKGMKRQRRSWIESEAGLSHPLFSSKYKPLVVESEPLKKVKKTQKLPKPLLESTVLPSLTLSTPRSMLSPPRVMKKISHDKSYNNSRANVNVVDTNSRESVQHSGSITKIPGARKNAAILVIPYTLPWVHLHGRVKIKVVRGIITILAHTLTPGMSYEIFSPSSSCLLSLQVDPVNYMSPFEVKSELEKKVMKNASGLEGLSDRSIGIIEVDRLESVVCDYVTTLTPFTKLFAPVLPADVKKSPLAGISLFNGSLKMALESEMSYPCMGWDDNYNEALDRWLETIDKAGCDDHSPVLVTCGAKNAGKSMFNRCAINMTLRSVPEVAYFDCDVGQTEFSPPATVSLHIIRKPILSPPFCHQRHAEKMVFYGDITPAQDPTFYVQCLHKVFQAYKELVVGKKLPLIVNTMGFPDGVGFMLFIDTLNITRPDFVIQFESEHLYANFPPVTPEMVALDEGWTFNKCPPSDIKERVSQVKEHILLLLPSLNRSEKNISSNRLHAADLRNLTMYSALSMGLSDNETLMSVTPHTIAYHNLAIQVCRYTLPVEEILVAIDASVVALCEADLTQAKRHSEDLPLTFDTMPLCDCLGLGIVRAVDVTKGLLYISTTLPRHLIRRANTILKGTLALSDTFILKQQNTSAYPVPYVDSLAQTTATFGLRTRSRMPRVHVCPKKTVSLAF